MDVEKTMQFILDTQARLEASVGEHNERLSKIEASVATLADLVGRLAQAEIRLVEKMDRLAESQAQLAESQAQLAESQAHTDQRLDALIDFADRFMRRNELPPQ
ncbi:MAG TPA: hypothetical protein VGZ29_16640 [Terriglobia bacterium]|nr:hypothetical protein [Terriglobia bacterium]